MIFTIGIVTKKRHNLLQIKEIKKRIEEEHGWEEEDDRTDEMEEWEAYKELTEEEKTLREAFVAIDRLKMTRDIAKIRTEHHGEEQQETKNPAKSNEKQRIRNNPHQQRTRHRNPTTL